MAAAPIKTDSFLVICRNRAVFYEAVHCSLQIDALGPTQGYLAVMHKDMRGVLVFFFYREGFMYPFSSPKEIVSSYIARKSTEMDCCIVIEKPLKRRKVAMANIAMV